MNSESPPARILRMVSALLLHPRTLPSMDPSFADVLVPEGLREEEEETVWGENVLSNKFSQKKTGESLMDLSGEPTASPAVGIVTSQSA